MIDVDRFKAVNDTYGHPVGDQVLLALARVLQQRLRNSDIVGRYGGEEFAVILQGITLAEATRIIDQLREDFAKIRFHAGEIEFYCAFSAGVASFPQFKDMKFLREAADRALYQAKKEGRNRVVANND
jgi:diguanylate cyclase (GGDEF)-like protein